jgi:N-acyl amino acid synthase of PEP-CTERM/exosortase system
MGESPRANAAHCTAHTGQGMAQVRPFKFGRMFEGVAADTSELQAECFRIRYQVYCIEQGFEDPASRQGLEETDEYDERSVHALLVHRHSGLSIGTIRLVLHEGGLRGSLPIHRVCQDPRIHDRTFLPLESTAEVSRLAIAKLVRGQIAASPFESARGEAAASPGQSPVLAIGLLRMAVELGLARGIRHVCAVMEPSLRRMLSRCGIHFEPLGPLVRYHGWRQPCYAAVSTLLHGIRSDRPDVWDVMTDGGRLRSLEAA